MKISRVIYLSGICVHSGNRYVTRVLNHSGRNKDRSGQMRFWINLNELGGISWMFMDFHDVFMEREFLPDIRCFQRLPRGSGVSIPQRMEMDGDVPKIWSVTNVCFAGISQIFLRSYDSNPWKPWFSWFSWGLDLPWIQVATVAKQVLGPLGVEEVALADALGPLDSSDSSSRRSRDMRGSLQRMGLSCGIFRGKSRWKPPKNRWTPWTNRGRVRDCDFVGSKMFSKKEGRVTQTGQTNKNQHTCPVVKEGAVRSYGYRQIFPCWTQELWMESLYMIGNETPRWKSPSSYHLVLFWTARYPLYM